MIVKFVKAEQPRRAKQPAKRRAKESAEYAGGKNEQEKVLALDFGNVFAENFADAVSELDADDRAYSGPGNNVAHVVFSAHADEKITEEMFQELNRSFLIDQGMADHKFAAGLHVNTENMHSYMRYLRTKPEPEADGSYKIQNFGGRHLWKNGTTNEYESARATVIDFCKKHGLKADFEDADPRPANTDGIRLTQGQRAWAAQHQQQHPVELFGKTAIDELRASKTEAEATNRLNAQGLSLRFVKTPDGTLKGGVISGPQGEKLYLSALPKDCSAKNLLARWNSKGGTVADAPKKGAGKAFYQGQHTAHQAKFHARKEIKVSGSMDEVNERLAAQNMRIEKQGKSGAYLVYQGKNGEEKMKLSALGGQYSLSALSKRFNASSTPHASNMHEKQASVNALSRKDASKMHADRAESRVSSATERAKNVAAEGAEAKTLSEALDDAFMQAKALDALRKAKAIAAEAEKRAQKMEERAQKAEKALKNRQHHEITIKNEVEDMFDFFKKKSAAQEEKIETVAQEFPNLDPRHEAVVAALIEIDKEEVKLREKGWSEDEIRMHPSTVRIPEHAAQSTTIEAELSKMEKLDTNTPQTETALKTENSPEANGENGGEAAKKRKFGFSLPGSSSGKKFGFGSSKPATGCRM